MSDEPEATATITLKVGRVSIAFDGMVSSPLERQQRVVLHAVGTLPLEREFLRRLVGRDVAAEVEFSIGGKTVYNGIAAAAGRGEFNGQRSYSLAVATQ